MPSTVSKAIVALAVRFASCAAQRRENALGACLPDM